MGPEYQCPLAARGRLLLQAGAAALALLLAGAACRHRGAEWGPPEPIPDPDSNATIELFVLGSPRESSSTRALTRELARYLEAAEAEEDRAALILWLGTDLDPPGPERGRPCPELGAAFAGPALAGLSAVVSDAVEAGATSWGLPGADGWRCGLSGYDAAAVPLPYRPAGSASLLRVDPKGGVRLASTCDADRCTVEPADAPPLLELVVLDLSPWLFPKLADETLSAAILDRQRSLLAALAEQPPAPRLLVSTIPIESAGARGLGGRKQRTSFRYLPEFLRAAIAEGLFVGAIGALERDLQLSEDLSHAIHRGARSFVARPIFQIVSGSAGGASHTLPTSRGMTLLPDLWSEQAGFARLLIHPGPEPEAKIHLHARVAGRWREAVVTAPLDPAPLEPLREPPTIQPCPSCDPQAGAADGEIFVPRDERPR